MAQYTTPPVVSILPKTLEFTPQGIVTKYAVKYKGVSGETELVIRDVNVRYTGGIVAAVSEQLKRLGFLED